jgi:hypothetical protein
MKDSNGKRIKEGCTVNVRIPYRSYQEHLGNNIPNGYYKEILEPEITNKNCIVEKHNNELCVMLNGERRYIKYFLLHYTIEDVKELIQSESEYMWSSEEEGELSYLLLEYGLKSERELLDFLGVFVIDA